MQPFSRNNLSPAASIVSPCTPPISHRSYSSGSTTITEPIMPAWNAPQYCAQNRWNVPSLVGSNHIEVYRPGSTSFFTRNAGTKKSWITSSDVIVSLTGRPSGTCNSLISRCPSGCSAFHINCLPVTNISIAPGGGSEFWKYNVEPHTKNSATIKVGTAVHRISRGKEPSIALGRSSGERRRYLIMK